MQKIIALLLSGIFIQANATEARSPNKYIFDVKIYSLTGPKNQNIAVPDPQNYSQDEAKNQFDRLTKDKSLSLKLIYSAASVCSDDGVKSARCVSGYENETSYTESSVHNESETDKSKNYAVLNPGIINTNTHIVIEPSSNSVTDKIKYHLSIQMNLLTNIDSIYDVQLPTLNYKQLSQTMMGKNDYSLIWSTSDGSNMDMTKKDNKQSFTIYVITPTILKP